MKAKKAQKRQREREREREKSIFIDWVVDRWHPCERC